MSQSAALQASLIVPCKMDACQMLVIDLREMDSEASQAGRAQQLLWRRGEPLEIVGRGLEVPVRAPAKQQPSGATSQTNICRREAGQSKGGKAPSSVWEPFPNTYFVLAKSLERRGEHQGHASRDEAPAPAPGMKNRTSRRFPAVVPRGASPLPLLRTGMAPSRPGLAQKQQPKFPPIKTASQVREETLAVASVLGQSDARTVEKWGALIRSAREKFSRGTAAFLREGLEPRRRPLAPEDLDRAPLWLLPKPPPKRPA
uniref:uncharacterized protein LOC114581530 isoform X1 n=1 Tax=Podarcis muralis TaxID=64176 RepID=UPI00109EFE5D|nr:uncharacterized protein LOC114581530 isoform X1 [Podarcis muralis]